MEKRLEDEIDEIVEKEIQNVRKIAEKYQLGNIYFYQLGDVNMETFKLMLVSKLPHVAKLNFLRYSEHFRDNLYLILGKWLNSRGITSIKKRQIGIKLKTKVKDIQNDRFVESPSWKYLSCFHPEP